jgi:hypothetical protein
MKLPTQIHSLHVEQGKLPQKKEISQQVLSSPVKLHDPIHLLHSDE